MCCIQYRAILDRGVKMFEKHIGNLFNKKSATCEHNSWDILYNIISLPYLPEKLHSDPSDVTVKWSMSGMDLGDIYYSHGNSNGKPTDNSWKYRELVWLRPRFSLELHGILTHAIYSGNDMARPIRDHVLRLPVLSGLLAMSPHGNTLDMVGSKNRGQWCRALCSHWY